MRAIALVPLLVALTPRGPHGPIGDRYRQDAGTARRLSLGQGVMYMHMSHVEWRVATEVTRLYLRGKGCWKGWSRDPS